MGIGDLQADGKAVDDATTFIAAITGQKPTVAKARKAIAGFKIRQGMPVGLCATLRGPRMNDLLDQAGTNCAPAYP
jgi:large subunit ribosomal protein L5